MADLARAHNIFKKTYLLPTEIGPFLLISTFLVWLPDPDIQRVEQGPFYHKRPILLHK